jgi:hypothetical protein
MLDVALPPLKSLVSLFKCRGMDGAAFILFFIPVVVVSN